MTASEQHPVIRGLCAQPKIDKSNQLTSAEGSVFLEVSLKWEMKKIREGPTLTRVPNTIPYLDFVIN